MYCRPNTLLTLLIGVDYLMRNTGMSSYRSLGRSCIEPPPTDRGLDNFVCLVSMLFTAELTNGHSFLDDQIL